MPQCGPFLDAPDQAGETYLEYAHRNAPHHWRRVGDIRPPLLHLLLHLAQQLTDAMQLVVAVANGLRVLIVRDLRCEHKGLSILPVQGRTSGENRRPLPPHHSTPGCPAAAPSARGTAASAGQTAR